jgi:hypothetical protein
VFELHYLGEVGGWIESSSAFLPANEDAVYYNWAIYRRFLA